MPGLSPDPAAIFVPLCHCARIGLAVSGGADSLALMLLAADFAAQTGSHGRFVVYSVDHRLRPEGAREAAFVCAEAKRLGLAARVLCWEGEKPATGLMAAARAARYRLIGAAMRADGCEVLVTAHHIADQAETVLMRLAHGSGTEGLRGMDAEAEIGGVRVVRPLLGTEPEALRALVAARGLTPVADPSNADTDYERVRWRALLPDLAALGLDARRIAGFSARMRQADAALDAMARGALAGVRFAPDGGAALERALLTGLPEAVATRLLGLVLDRVSGGRRRHALAALEALAERLRRGPLRATLHGCLVSAGSRSIRVRRETGRAGERSRLREAATP
jgi:tRNA(Ile)-lysidine synthase